MRTFDIYPKNCAFTLLFDALPMVSAVVDGIELLSVTEALETPLIYMATVVPFRTKAT